MASILKVDELQGITAAGDITVTSEGGAATQSLQQGLAKAWNNINGTGTIAVRDSFNISSIADNGTGVYTHSLSNSMSTSDSFTFSGFVRCSGNVGYLAGDDDNTFTSSSVKHATYGSGATNVADALYATIDIHGDLA